MFYNRGSMNFYFLEVFLRIIRMIGYLFYLVDRDVRWGKYIDCVYFYFFMMRFISIILWLLDVSLGL